MPDPEPPPGAPPQPPAAWVASRLQARFEGTHRDAPSPSAPPPPPPGARLQPGGGPRPSVRGSDPAPADHDLHEDLALLRRQLDGAFDELDQRLEAAETRASVAEARASVAEARAAGAEARAADAEARAYEALALLTELQRRLTADDGGREPEGGAGRRGALDRLRNRLDTGAG